MDDSTKPSTTEALLAALEAHPGSTTADLADHAGIGKSTAAKALVRLEGEQRAVRQHRDRDQAGRREPDLWSVALPVASDPTAPTPKDALKAEAAPKAEATPKAEAASKAEAAPGTKERLGKGQLRQLVLGHLAAAGEPQSPSGVAKAIGHSAGAITNCLERLAKSGEVSEISQKPRRYAANQG